MAISIRNPKVEQMARELSTRSGLGMTKAIGDALDARLDELDASARRRLAVLERIAGACAAAPDIDHRSEDEVLGYSESGSFDEDGAKW